MVAHTKQPPIVCLLQSWRMPRLHVLLVTALALVVGCPKSDPEAAENATPAAEEKAEAKDEAKARKNVHEITAFPIDTENQTATQAVVPEGADPDLMLFGRPETVAEDIERRVFEMGFNEVMCSFVSCDDVDVDTDGLPGWPGRWLGGMRLFAEQIMPLLKK